MVTPPKIVRKNLLTGKIEVGFFYEKRAKVGFDSSSKGYFVLDDYLYVHTAEIAMDKDQKDMAKAWAKEHDCPNDCSMILCSSKECPKVERKPLKLTPLPCGKIAG